MQRAHLPFLAQETDKQGVNWYTETLDALKRLRAPKRPRTQSYHAAQNGTNTGAVPWYWGLLARLSTVMILGG